MKTSPIIYQLMNVIAAVGVLITKSPSTNNLPGFIQSSTENHVGSNPTPGAYGSTPCVDSRHIQQIEPSALSEIINFRLWMRKQGYRHSTIKYSIQALKSIARKTNLLRPESAKSYLASAPNSESRKAKLTEDLARFFSAYEHIPFEKTQTPNPTTNESRNYPSSH